MTSRIGRRKRSNRRRGFTLIELIIVAAIITVLIAVSSPLFKTTLRDVEMKDAAYNISKLIRLGQQRAIIEEKRHRLLIDFNKRAYYLRAEEAEAGDGGYADDNIAPPPEEETAAAGEGAAFPAEQVDASGVIWKKISGRFGEYFYLPDGVKFKGDTDKITFLPNGRCDRASVYIAGQKNKIIKITTNGKAGYVEVSEVRE